MAIAALGKRTRRAVERGEQYVVPPSWLFGSFVLDPWGTPTKRARREPAIPTSHNDENQDPEGDGLRDTEYGGSDASRAQANSQSEAKVPLTPATPRHRDVFCNSPRTPRHAVMSAGKLFKRLTPTTPLSPSTVPTIYHAARQLFARGSEPGRLVGRESEREQMADFLTRCASSRAANGCLYISGPPGTGKSAMAAEMTEQYRQSKRVKSAFINCMSIKSSKDLYSQLLGAIHEGDGDEVSEADAVSALQSTFRSNVESSITYLVTLDEIDHILTLGLESLYRLFEWSLQKGSCLVLIGIANALDLTDRFLPRLKSKNLKPDLLSFIPYTASQIKIIITSRLKSLDPNAQAGHVPFIHPAAIELCSRKVSSQTGDLRKAFEICRRALDLVEAETKEKHENAAREKLLQLTPSKKRPLGDHVNGTKTAAKEPTSTVAEVMAASLKALTCETAPRASIAHLNKVTAAAFGNGTSQRLKALNLQQKAALCALVAYENRTRAALQSQNVLGTPTKSQTLAPTIKMLFEVYCRLCTRDSVLHPLSSSEFREVAGSLETLGLVGAVNGKNGSFAVQQTPSRRGRKAAQSSGDEKRIASCASEKELESVADGAGAGILRSILSGDAMD